MTDEKTTPVGASNITTVEGIPSKRGKSSLEKQGHGVKAILDVDKYEVRVWD